NLQIEERWGLGDAKLIESYARELTGLAPDAIMTLGIRASSAQRQQSRSIPQVFLATGDLVAQGLVESFSRPGGNATGFLLFELSIVGKYLEVLRETAPRLARTALLVNSGNPSAADYTRAFEAAAAKLGIAAVVLNLRDAKEIEPAIAAFAGEGGGGLVVPP